MAKLEPDDDLIRRLAALLEETGLSEIEYEAGGHRIRVGRTLAVAAPAAVSTAASASASSNTPATAPTAEEGVPAGAIVSPMVGTVYVSPEPGTPPFVKVGDEVKEGQTLLIIEAMKVMNPLASPRAGKVKRVFIRDGQPVEFGEPLIVVE
jgi:acetyl-CoA carboxylase biotin carboxyl carrier protein